MFPSRFDYSAPDSLDEALATLGQRADETKVLAGGQSLIPLLKLRFAAPAALVDINRIPGLDVVEESNGHLRIGTLARHNQLAADSLVGRRYPTIASAAPQIADPLVRNRACDPGGDGRETTRRRGCPPRRVLQPAAAPAQGIDPICGMSVAIVEGAITATHVGETYYFCAPGCRKAFLRDPEGALERASAG
jgi:CO/xanthine dehydrogenase FAD-binding subunit